MFRWFLCVDSHKVSQSSNSVFMKVERAKTGQILPLSTSVRYLASPALLTDLFELFSSDALYINMPDFTFRFICVAQLLLFR